MDSWDATWITNKLYRLVEKYKVRVTLDAKPGSLELVAIVVGVGDLIYHVHKDFVDYIIKKRRRKKELAKIKIKHEGKVKYI